MFSIKFNDISRKFGMTSSTLVMVVLLHSASGQRKHKTGQAGYAIWRCCNERAAESIYCEHHLSLNSQRKAKRREQYRQKCQKVGVD